MHNQLEVALPESDYRDDVKLATAANNALAANITVPDTVEATADDGNITLTGTVSYGTERAAAEAAVAGVAGVRNVINDIEISYVPIRSTSTCTSRRRWTARRRSPTAAT